MNLSKLKTVFGGAPAAKRKSSSKKSASKPTVKPAAAVVKPMSKTAFHTQLKDMTASLQTMPGWAVHVALDNVAYHVTYSSESTQYSIEIQYSNGSVAGYFGKSAMPKLKSVNPADVSNYGFVKA
jgi:hypothetical protein